MYDRCDTSVGGQKTKVLNILGSAYKLRKLKDNIDFNGFYDVVRHF